MSSGALPLAEALEKIASEDRFSGVADFKMPTSSEKAYDAIMRQISEFEAGLSPEEEIGGRIVGCPGADGAFHIESVAVAGSDTIAFHGKNSHGKPVRLVQHVTQMSVLLTCFPVAPEQPARRIGFKMEPGT